MRRPFRDDGNDFPLKRLIYNKKSKITEAMYKTVAQSHDKIIKGASNLSENETRPWLREI
ncbi:3691_t:CDS:1, partial [Acaulospora morrowiae]